MTAIEPARGLSAADLASIAALEQRVVAHDGGRLKLEWRDLRSRDGEVAEDVLAREGEQVIGFIGIYRFGPTHMELAGMVDPPHRRRGIGGGLLDAALALAGAAGAHEPLLIVPRGSEGGRALAARRGAAFDHSEHALVLRGEPRGGSTDPELSMRIAERRDVPAITSLITSGFGFAPADVGVRLAQEGVRTLVFEREGRVVATMRISIADPAAASVYGFAVEPALRGRGIGRDALRRACRDLRERGAQTISLEVEVENDRALRLYTSLGFELVTTEDYWAIAI